ncbi:MAG: HAMP domain-containing protein [Rhodocyclaceae bacterium]|nr:HAMP domain-containing protein [Rhodocyclaceae bacterium]
MIARAVVAPVRELTRTFQAISQGDEENVGDINTMSSKYSATELKVLDQAFRNMLSRLQSSQHDLRSLNLCLSAGSRSAPWH